MTDIERVEALAFALGLPDGIREFQFAPWRKWAFDLAWPGLRLAIEVEGGAWIEGRHVQPVGFEKDCEKYSTAAALGWRVLRATPRQIKGGWLAEWLKMAVGGRL